MTISHPLSLYIEHCFRSSVIVSVLENHDVVATIRVAFIMLYVMLVVGSYLVLELQ